MLWLSASISGDRRRRESQSGVSGHQINMATMRWETSLGVPLSAREGCTSVEDPKRDMHSYTAKVPEIHSVRKHQ